METDERPRLAVVLQEVDLPDPEARRQSRYLAAHVQPTLAQKAEYPERGWIIGLVAVFSLLSWGIVSLVYYSLRDRA